MSVLILWYRSSSPAAHAEKHTITTAKHNKTAIRLFHNISPSHPQMGSPYRGTSLLHILFSWQVKRRRENTAAPKIILFLQCSRIRRSSSFAATLSTCSCRLTSRISRSGSGFFVRMTETPVTPVRNSFGTNPTPRSALTIGRI